jgi:ABC-type transport system substrate-binding protein
MDGALVTAEDVVGHLERAIKPGDPSRTPAVQRSQDYASIEDVRAAEDGRGVIIRTSRPDPFLLQTLAGRFALVQSPRTVQAFESSWSKLDPASVVGSGPFVLESSGGGMLRFTAHSRGHQPPLLDGIDVSEPWDVASRFRDRHLDEAILRDRRDAPALLEQLGPGLQLLSRFEESPVISTLFVGSPPWDNPALLKALSAALTRAELASRLFAGRADPAGPVFPAHTGFALSEQELGAPPGYRALDEDWADARRLWEAGGGPGLGQITIDFPAIFDPPYSASGVVTGMLNEALAGQFRASVDSYSAISQRASVHSYGNGRAAFWFGWGPPLPEPDPSRWLVETFSSTGPGNAATGYAAERADALLRALSQEFDLTDGKTGEGDSGLFATNGGGGVMPWLLQRAEVLRWPYYEAHSPSPFWEQHLGNLASIDSSNPSFTARGG